MIDRRLLENFDWGLFFVTLLIAAAALLNLYSAVNQEGVSGDKIVYYKQLTWIGVGFFMMLLMIALPYSLLDRYAYFIYGLGLAMLIYVLFAGKLVSGSQRWLSLGPVSIQPSEFAKLCVVVALSRYYARTATQPGMSLRELITPFFLVLVPFLLIARQPDLGTGGLIVLIAGSLTLFAKIRWKTLRVLLILICLCVPAVWFSLHDYQKERIHTFLNPERDPLGAGYHIIQSKIAIGSGMVTGKGYLAGTQKALAFLPEKHTDFIFSVLAEEWGLLGASVILVLFSLLLLWCLNVAFRSKDPFGAFLAVGITCMLFWQVFINIGMVMGLMPVVGVPLPLVSYGGSSVLTTMMGIGMLISVSMRRFMFE